MAVAVPRIATVDALREPYDAPVPVVVMYSILLCPDVVDAMDGFRHKIGLDERVPCLLWWMTVRPVEPESDPYAILSCWKNEHAYWRWLRNNAACITDIVRALQREHGRVVRELPKTTIWRLTHYAVAPESD